MRMQPTPSGRALPPPEPKATSSSSTVLSELLCGSFGGLCAALATHPLDTIKTRIQSSSVVSPQIGAVVRGILRTDGASGFDRGIAVPMVSQPLYVGSSFAGLQAGYCIWDHYQPMGADATGREEMPRLMFAGGLGGAACAIAVTPGERLKVLLQIQGQNGVATQSPLQTLRSVVAVGGWSSMFVGIQATMMREVPGTILWFGAFESVSVYAQQTWELQRPLAVLCGAVAAGLAFWLPIIPIDNVKTRQQSAQAGEANGAIAIARQIIRTRGFAGFWAGFRPILARGILLDIFQFSGADQLRNGYATLQRGRSSSKGNFVM